MQFGQQKVPVNLGTTSSGPKAEAVIVCNLLLLESPSCGTFNTDCIFIASPFVLFSSSSFSPLFLKQLFLSQFVACFKCAINGLFFVYIRSF